MVKLDADKSWKCQNDTDTTIANTDTLAGLSCQAGEIPKFISGSWQCKAEDANTDALASLQCTNAQIPKMTASGWACGSDADTDTIATLNKNCGNTGYARYNGSAWVFHCPKAPTKIQLNAVDDAVQEVQSCAQNTEVERKDEPTGNGLLSAEPNDLEVTFSIVGGKVAANFKIVAKDTKTATLKFSKSTARGKEYHVIIQAQETKDGRSLTKLYSIDTAGCPGD